MALAAVVAAQLTLGLALLIGLRVQVGRSAEAVGQLIQVVLPKAPPLPPPPPERKAASKAESAPKAQPAPPGGSPGPKPAHAPPSVAPVVSIRPTVAPSGGGTGSGPASGSGAGGGGQGGNGYGNGRGGGTELEQIAGDIEPRDYPKRLRKAGIGGRVGLLFTVGTNGRVTQCTVTRSSGVPELDQLTCRLILQRFVYRPATDRFGRPVPDQVEGEHIWDVGGDY